MDQTLGEYAVCGVLRRRAVRPGHGGFQCCGLARQHDLVEFPLPGRVHAVDGKRPGHVRRVVLEFATGVDQHQVAVPKKTVVPYIVHDAGVASAGDDRRIRCSAGSALHECVHQHCFELRLAQVRLAVAHRVDVRPRRNVPRSRHQSLFGGRLEQALLVQQALQGAELAPADVGSPRAGGGCRFDQAPVEIRVFAQYGVNAPAAIENARQNLVQLGVCECGVDPQRLRCTLWTQPFPGPLLPCRIALRTEEYGCARFRPGCEYQNAVGLFETRKVVEVAVLAERILGVAIAIADRRAGNDGDIIVRE